MTLLGTGTPAPSLSRVSSGNLLEIGDDVIVLDHGPGAAHRLLEAGQSPVNVTHFFLTHLHFDNIVDCPSLVLQRFDHAAGHKPELYVFGPAPVARLTNQLFAKDGVYDLDLTARTNGGHIDVVEIATRANAKTLVVTHMPASLDEPGILERMVYEMHQIYDGNIVVGRDLLEVPVKLGRSGHFD